MAALQWREERCQMQSRRIGRMEIPEIRALYIRLVLGVNSLVRNSTA